MHRNSRHSSDITLFKSVSSTQLFENIRPRGLETIGLPCKTKLGMFFNPFRHVVSVFTRTLSLS